MISPRFYNFSWHVKPFKIISIPSWLFKLLIPQSCLSGSAQGIKAAVCHEKDQQAEPDFKEPNTTGICGERHPDLCRKPFRGVHVLLLWDTAAPVHGHGVCWRSAASFCSSLIWFTMKNVSVTSHYRSLQVETVQHCWKTWVLCLWIWPGCTLQRQYWLWSISTTTASSTGTSNRTSETLQKQLQSVFLY